VGRSKSAERSLSGAAVSVATVAAALRALPADVVPGDVCDAPFLLNTAEGLLFEALASILKPVRTSVLNTAHVGRNCGRKPNSTGFMLCLIGAQKRKNL
jgi:hypothetical protein